MIISKMQLSYKEGYYVLLLTVAVNLSQTVLWFPIRADGLARCNTWN